MRIFKYTVVLLGLLIPFGTVYTAEDTGKVVITDAWIREAPPGARVMGGYLTVKNTHDEDIVVSGSSSSLFKMVEIHKTEVVDGNARMDRQERILIPSGSSLTFEPGGLHLMMMMPNSPIRKGDVVDITFQLETGEQIPFQAPVQQENSQ